MKKLFFAFALTLVIGAPLAHAQSSGYVPLAPIPGLTQGVVANSAGLTSFLQNLYKYLIGIAAILAVIQIIRGGVEIMGQESITKKGEGRAHIQQALLGLVLVLAPVLVFTIINPAILNLSLSLPPIGIQPSGSGASASNPASSGSNAAANSTSNNASTTPSSASPPTPTIPTETVTVHANGGSSYYVLGYWDWTGNANLGHQNDSNYGQVQACWHWDEYGFEDTSATACSGQQSELVQNEQEEYGSYSGYMGPVIYYTCTQTPIDSFPLATPGAPTGAVCSTQTVSHT